MAYKVQRRHQAAAGRHMRGREAVLEHSGQTPSASPALKDPFPAPHSPSSMGGNLRGHSGSTGAPQGSSSGGVIRPQARSWRKGLSSQARKLAGSKRPQSEDFAQTIQERNKEGSATSDERDHPKLVPRSGEGRRGQEIDEYLMRLLRSGAANAADATMYRQELRHPNPAHPVMDHGRLAGICEGGSPQGTSVGAALGQIRQVDQTSGQSTEPESEGSGQEGSREQANADQSGVGNNRSNPNGNGVSDKQSERLGSGNSFKRQLSREEQHEQDRQQMPPPQSRGCAAGRQHSLQPEVGTKFVPPKLVQTFMGESAYSAVRETLLQQQAAHMHQLSELHRLVGVQRQLTQQLSFGGGSSAGSRQQPAPPAPQYPAVYRPTDHQGYMARATGALADPGAAGVQHKGAAAAQLAWTGRGQQEEVTAAVNRAAQGLRHDQQHGPAKPELQGGGRTSLPPNAPWFAAALQHSMTMAAQHRSLMQSGAAGGFDPLAAWYAVHFGQTAESSAVYSNHLTGMHPGGPWADMAQQLFMSSWGQGPPPQYGQAFMQHLLRAASGTDATPQGQQLHSHGRAAQPTPSQHPPESQRQHEQHQPQHQEHQQQHEEVPGHQECPANSQPPHHGHMPLPTSAAVAAALIGVLGPSQGTVPEVPSRLHGQATSEESTPGTSPTRTGDWGAKSPTEHYQMPSDAGLDRTVPNIQTDEALDVPQV
eukprot:jgi/Astpho2/5319/Aster-x0673